MAQFVAGCLPHADDLLHRIFGCGFHPIPGRPRQSSHVSISRSRFIANLEALVPSSLILAVGARIYDNARTNTKPPQSGCWVQPIVRYFVRLFFCLCRSVAARAAEFASTLGTWAWYAF